ncbi:MAG: SPOR domain-containing protein [Cellvibrio sp.]
MSRDYAKKPRSSSRSGSRRTSKNEQTPGWVIFIAGFLVGSLFSGYIAMKYFSPEEETAKPEKPKPANNVPKPRFDFYKLLQESETIVPANETPNREESQPNKPAITDTNEYLLQVGSFPTNSDADRLRAQLILLGLDARIEKVEIRRGEEWHRVMVGPFKNQTDLNKARATLVAEGYNALVLKRAKSR